MEKGIAFTLGLQQSTGEVYWARDTNNIADPVALVATSSCIWESLRCGIRIATILGISKPDWDEASRKLAEAISEHPELFRDGDNRYNYAMSWYYPVLTGVTKGQKARERIFSRWEDFVIDSWGCKCVAEEPWWVTVAETCELVIALIRIGEHKRARMLLNWILRLQDSDGRFWTGIKIPEKEVWPPDLKPTWAASAIITAVAAGL